MMSPADQTGDEGHTVCRFIAELEEILLLVSNGD